MGDNDILGPKSTKPALEAFTTKMSNSRAMAEGDNDTCLELALEGEKLCKAGKCRDGVAFFEAALQVIKSVCFLVLFGGGGHLEAYWVATGSIL